MRSSLHWRTMWTAGLARVYLHTGRCAVCVTAGVRLVCCSDPDSSLPNKLHMLQTAEGLRRAGHPDWMQLMGLVHDLGKIMYLWGSPEDGQEGTGEYLCAGIWQTHSDNRRLPCPQRPDSSGRWVVTHGWWAAGSQTALSCQSSTR